LRGAATADRILPPPNEQVARYVSAAKPLVEQAAAAGVSFAHAALSTKAPRKAPTPPVDDLAGEAGTAVVEALRRRLEQAIASGESEDPAALVESLGSAYREWKSQRVERIAGDILAAAFSRGTWHATPDGLAVRWIAEDIDGPCPDCDDDSLAGNVPKSETFPTGQHYPPAHSGCRCLLVPVHH
jgi:hypothetical protein